MAYRDNFYRPDEQKERDRRRAKEDASVRKAVARRRAARDKKVMTDADIQKKKDAIKKAQSLTPYSKVIRSKKTQRGIIARMEAKREGRAAAVRIAKARRLKQRKAPITQQAVGLNSSARRNRDEAKSLQKYLAYDEGMYRTNPDGTKTLYKKRALAAQAKRAEAGLKTNPIYDNVKRKEFSAQRAATMSKDNARKSGGLATAMKRNAEAGLSHMVRGRAMKGVARASGVLGIAALVAQHLGGKKENKNG